MKKIGIAANMELSRIATAAAADTIDVSIGENQIVFGVDGVSLSARRIDGQFPNYRQLVPQTFDHEIPASREELLDVVRRTSSVLMGRDDASLRIRVIEKSTGAANLVTIPLALFQSGGYKSLQAIHERLVEAAGSPPFTARMGKVTETAHTFEQLRPRILELAQEGLNLQRFKGLGEMNPEQLWETTMNPENRVLKKVSLEDATAAEEMFSVLMGDRVEPRRDFIERNARTVKFLDV